jgi:hypothetical protein
LQLVGKRGRALALRNLPLGKCGADGHKMRVFTGRIRVVGTDRRPGF